MKALDSSMVRFRRPTITLAVSRPRVAGFDEENLPSRGDKQRLKAGLARRQSRRGRACIERSLEIVQQRDRGIAHGRNG